MNSRIKSAFNEIYADHQLKENTKYKLMQTIQNNQQKGTIQWTRIAIASMCIIFSFIIGYGFISYNIEVSAISIDINPSIELGINQYDRVIKVKSFNKDGEKIIQSVNVRNMLYEEAVNAILECGKTSRYVNDDNIVVITVDSDTDEKSNEVADKIKHCHSSGNNDLYCYISNGSSVKAHSLGLSFGKYSAYLELKKYQPDITVEEVKGLSMREIRNRIENGKDSSVDSSTEDTVSQTVNSQNCQQHSNCNKHQYSVMGNKGKKNH